MSDCRAPHCRCITPGDQCDAYGEERPYEEEYEMNWQDRLPDVTAMKLKLDPGTGILVTTAHNGDTYWAIVVGHRLHSRFIDLVSEDGNYDTIDPAHPNITIKLNLESKMGFIFGVMSWLAKPDSEAFRPRTARKGMFDYYMQRVALDELDDNDRRTLAARLDGAE